MQTTTLRTAINALEKKVLARGSSMTTQSEIEENGTSECRKYYAWLRQQAPVTAMPFPMFDDLVLC